jgi:cytochrome c oxidase subunit 2
MTSLIIFLIILLLAVVIVQISKVSELAAKIRGEEEVALQSNNRTALWLVIFMVLFLVYCFVSAYWYKDFMLGYGPNDAASAHGGSLDSMFNMTLIFTGIVFVITQILLFWYPYKYRRQAGRKAFFFPHNNTLELIWTIVPTIVLTILVARGLVVWNDVMFDVDPDEDYIEIEATGYQFAWDIRYPGPDNKIGTKNYKLIQPGINPLGQDWSDPKNIDDFQPSEIVLPVDTTVRVRITSKDVLHNFYLPHFRVKMDAVPGLPTYFVFRPITTTEEYRQQLRESPVWQVPADPDDPEGPEKWETFDYELACAELCGKGHYSMRKILKIVSKSEYEDWLATQKSYYMQNIRNTEYDPFVGQLLKPEIEERALELKSDFSNAISSDDLADKLINLRHIFYETGSSDLNARSNFELDNLASLMKENPGISVELSGHTDNTGDLSINMRISSERAKKIREALISRGIEGRKIQTVGFGPNRPIDTNDTEEGRQNNRRTELRIIG